MTKAENEKACAAPAEVTKRAWVTPDFTAIDLSSARAGATTEPDSLPN